MAHASKVAHKDAKDQKQRPKNGCRFVFKKTLQSPKPEIVKTF